MSFMEIDMIASFKSPHALLGAARDLRIAIEDATPGRQAVRPERRDRSGTPKVSTAVKPSGSLWLTVEHESPGEKLMLAVLTIAALAGIALAFAAASGLAQVWGYST
jgi:hypothetical protein